MFIATDHATRSKYASPIHIFMQPAMLGKSQTPEQKCAFVLATMVRSNRRVALVEEALADRRSTETRNPIVAANLALEFIIVRQFLICTERVSLVSTCTECSKLTFFDVPKSIDDDTFRASNPNDLGRAIG